MGFASGSVTFRRFLVVGQQPEMIDQSVLDKLQEFILQVGEFSVPEESEYGWCGGRHVLDGKFSFEHNVFNDALHCALRIDTNRVPADLKKAYQIMEEEAVAATNPSGFISKQQKRDVKDVVRRKIDEDLKSGKFRRSKLVPILWDLPTQTVYSPASSKAVEMLLELFERTFGLNLEPVSAGTVAARYLQASQKTREYEDFRPTRFVQGPEGEGQMPEYPWTAMGPQPKDFLGNEFLLWLWHQVDSTNGIIKTDEAGDVALVLEKSVELDCAYGQTGKDALKGDDPTGMPEAHDALRSGKLPRKIGMIMETGGHQFQFAFNCEAMGCSGTVLPEVEDAENARVVFEERISMLRDLSKGIDGLFHTFLKLRASSAWEGHCNTIRRWITQATKHAAA